MPLDDDQRPQTITTSYQRQDQYIAMPLDDDQRPQTITTSYQRQDQIITNYALDILV